MKNNKLEAGTPFPRVIANNLDGEAIDITKPRGKADWQMLVVYRGRHCPMCTKFLNELQSHSEALADAGIDVAAVSADSEGQLRDHLVELEVSFPFYYGLTTSQLKELGLYISHPRSPQETDHPFPEPGLFVINDEGLLQVADISNNPFARPALETLVGGLKWIRDPENNYPIRGTYDYDD